ncbi:MAG: thioredoxin [Oscillospiraceae bacterium]|jgi:thioredoxin 1|nr:thioredoxin [Oscillospiraceae bacterium]
MALVHLSEQDFVNTIVTGATLVDFWASWCGPCKLVAPVIEELSEQYADRVTVAKVDVDANESVAASYGITAIPTVILFRDGEEAARFVGVRPKEEYESVLDGIFG